MLGDITRDANSSICGMTDSNYFMGYFNHLLKQLETCPELKSSQTDLLKHVVLGLVCGMLGSVVGEQLYGDGLGGLLGIGAGGIVGYAFVSHDCGTLVRDIRRLPHSEKEKLVAEVQHHLGSDLPEDLDLSFTDKSSRKAVLHLLKKFTKQT